jgi:hypothetical protein
MMDEGEGSSTYAGLEVAIREYDLTISAIKNESLQLYDDYVATTRSFNRLVDRAVGPPPVDPASLFEAHDYSGGMRLVVEEYWMNFHLKYQQELQNKIVALKNVANELRRLISTKQQKQLDEIIGTLAPVRPAAATIILDGMEKLRALLRLVIDQEIAKIEDAKKIVVSLVPSGELLLGLEFTLRLEMLRSLQDRGLLALLTFDDVTDLMTLMASSLAGVRAQEMRDEKKLIEKVDREAGTPERTYLGRRPAFREGCLDNFYEAVRLCEQGGKLRLQRRGPGGKERKSALTGTNAGGCSYALSAART